MSTSHRKLSEHEVVMFRIAYREMVGCFPLQRSDEVPNLKLVVNTGEVSPLKPTKPKAKKKRR